MQAGHSLAWTWCWAVTGQLPDRCAIQYLALTSHQRSLWERLSERLRSAAHMSYRQISCFLGKKQAGMTTSMTRRRHVQATHFWYNLAPALFLSCSSVPQPAPEGPRGARRRRGLRTQRTVAPRTGGASGVLIAAAAWCIPGTCRAAVPRRGLSRGSHPGSADSRLEPGSHLEPGGGPCQVSFWRASQHRRPRARASVCFARTLAFGLTAVVVPTRPDALQRDPRPRRADPRGSRVPRARPAADQSLTSATTAVSKTCPPRTSQRHDGNLEDLLSQDWTAPGRQSSKPVLPGQTHSTTESDSFTGSVTFEALSPPDIDCAGSAQPHQGTNAASGRWRQLYRRASTRPGASPSG